VFTHGARLSKRVSLAGLLPPSRKESQLCVLPTSMNAETQTLQKLIYFKKLTNTNAFTFKIWQQVVVLLAVVLLCIGCSSVPLSHNPGKLSLCQQTLIAGCLATDNPQQHGWLVATQRFGNNRRRSNLALKLGTRRSELPFFFREFCRPGRMDCRRTFYSAALQMGVSYGRAFR